MCVLVSGKMMRDDDHRKECVYVEKIVKLKVVGSRSTVPKLLFTRTVESGRSDDIYIYI